MTIAESLDRIKAIDADVRNGLQPVVFLLDDLVAQPDDLTSEDIASARDCLQRVVSALALARAEIESVRTALFGSSRRCNAKTSSEITRARALVNGESPLALQCDLNEGHTGRHSATDEQNTLFEWTEPKGEST